MDTDTRNESGPIKNHEKNVPFKNVNTLKGERNIQLNRPGTSPGGYYG